MTPLQVCYAVSKALHPGTKPEEEGAASRMEKYLRGCVKNATKKANGGSRVARDKELIRQLKTAQAVLDRTPSVTLASFPLMAGVVAKVDPVLAEALRTLQHAAVSGLGPLPPPAPAAPSPRAGSPCTAAVALPSVVYQPLDGAGAEWSLEVLPEAVERVLPGGPLLLTAPPPSPLPKSVPGLPHLAPPKAARPAPAVPPGQGSAIATLLSQKPAARTGDLRLRAAPAVVAVAPRQLPGHMAPVRTSGRQPCTAAAAVVPQTYYYHMGQPLPKTVQAWVLTEKQLRGRYGVKPGKGPVPNTMPISRQQRGFEQWSIQPVNTDRPQDVAACSYETFKGRLGTVHRFLGFCLREHKVPDTCLSMELLTNPVGTHWVSSIAGIQQYPIC